MTTKKQGSSGAVLEPARPRRGCKWKHVVDCRVLFRFRRLL